MKYNRPNDQPSIYFNIKVCFVGIAPKERPTKVAKENTVDQDGQRSRNEGMLLKISLRSINMYQHDDSNIQRKYGCCHTAYT